MGSSQLMDPVFICLIFYYKNCSKVCFDKQTTGKVRVGFNTKRLFRMVTFG